MESWHAHDDVQFIKKTKAKPKDLGGGVNIALRCLIDLDLNCSEI